MANRQYVGARYVPKFYQGTNGNEWESGVAYEALTMVTYLNNTYCSKKPVPARTVAPNLDTEYWVLTAAYSSQVAELREVVEGIEDDVKDIQRDITELGTTIDNDIEDVEDIIKSDYLIAISDSYGMNITDNWLKFLKDYWGDKMYYSAVSGSSMIQSIEYPEVKNFLRQLTEVIEPQLKNDGVDKKLIKHIVIGGGYNDGHWSTTTEAVLAWQTAARTFYNYAKANYPNAKISLAYFGWQLYSENSQYPLSHQIKGRSLYQGAGMQVGFNYITGSEGCNLWDGYIETADPFHPTREGALEEAMCVFQTLKTGSYEIKKDKTVNAWINADTSRWDGANSIEPIYMEQHGTMIKLQTTKVDNNLIFRTTTPFNLAAGSEIKLGTIPETKCSFNTLNKFIPCNVSVSCTEAYNGTALLHIDSNRNVSISFNWNALTNISAIFVQTFETEYDPIMLR